jgi:hypothetical protein
MSSYITIDDADHLSIEFTDIYVIEGILTFLTVGAIDIPSVSKWTSSYYWKPLIKQFSSKDQLEKYMSTLTPITHIDLALYGDMTWCHNIGHGLFDGLYPMYTALVKFGYKDAPFTVLTDINPNDGGQKMAAEITTKFSENTFLNYHTLDKSTTYHFKKLISGSNNTGNRVITKEYRLYGEVEFGALTAFKQRMYRTYALAVDQPVNAKLQGIIIHNKRYSPDEIRALKQLCASCKACDLKYIDWQDYPTFRDQLVEISNTDIHITGPGTGMMYMPFLKRGAVNINLGYMERTQTNCARPNLKIATTSISDFILPAYLEQSVCAGANYINTIYYDRFVNNSIEYDPLNTCMTVAIDLVGQIKGNNLHTDALIFIEYCKRTLHPDQICKHLTDIALMIELFVHEHPHAVLKPFVDINLLRSIKKEFNYGNTYDILPKL